MGFPPEPRLVTCDTCSSFSRVKYSQTAVNKTAQNDFRPPSSKFSLTFAINIRKYQHDFFSLFMTNLPFQPPFIGLGGEEANCSFCLNAEFHPIISTVAVVFLGKKIQCSQHLARGLGEADFLQEKSPPRRRMPTTAGVHLTGEALDPQKSGPSFLCPDDVGKAQTWINQRRASAVCFHSSFWKEGGVGLTYKPWGPGRRAPWAGWPRSLPGSRLGARRSVSSFSIVLLWF